VTAAGISAGIDMALHLVDRLLGHTMAERTARQMEYRWGG
jgi:transcriptional regulator GlxA family with amidase domain